jgi:hypothetical protein
MARIYLGGEEGERHLGERTWVRTRDENRFDRDRSCGRGISGHLTASHSI